MNQHEQLMQLLVQRYLGDPDPRVGELAAGCTPGLIRYCFANYRGHRGVSHGLRLTDFGHTAMCRYFTHYGITPAPYDEPTVQGKPRDLSTHHMLWLDRNTTMPWHWHRGELTLFESQLAMRVRLLGDLDQLVLAFQ